jgi:hypothetical protein
LIEALNEDLSREYQAIIAYVTYSQVLKGAAYMNIADELAVHAGEELQHALKVASHIDYHLFALDGRSRCPGSRAMLSAKQEANPDARRQPYRHNKRHQNRFH